MRFRGKSIRRKIVVLLLVPLVSLVSIWGFATYLTARDATALLNATDIVDRVGYPAQNAARALQSERRETLVYLADPRRSDALTRLHAQQHRTDKVVAKIRGNAADHELRADLSDAARARLDDLVDGLTSLGDLRTQTEDSTLTRGGAFQAYNELVDPCFTFLSSLTPVDDSELEKEGRALVGLVRAREYLSREDALMAAALVADEMTKGDRRAFSDRVAERHLAYGNDLPLLPAEDRETFQKYWNGTDGRTLSSYEDAIIAAGPEATGVLGAERWRAATTAVLTDLDSLNHEADHRFHERVEPEAVKVLFRAGAVGVLGFAAVMASLVISFRVGRGLVRDLSTLRKQAHESAGVRLPGVMRRLATGEEVDVETEAPRLEYPQDEMGQVGQALNTLQRAAVEAAVKQADMRRGVSEVFVNLARRNQVLLHRQLTLLDAMERRTEDADELEDLFKIDHLTTRMRRHAEGLVILSGATPSRQWRKPVQLMDVVRAAVAEVEDYERIEVRRLPRLAVDGSAVADLTHLIAELLENATVFSPPHTAVQVLGERVANGFTLEIHDRGLGMPSEALLDANLRLAETPEFELSDTDRLGLFVVARLAQRQGVRVSLQPSPYGGATAVVLIPGAILTETPEDAEEDGEYAADGRAGREAGAGATAPGHRREALLAGSVPPLESGSGRQRALDGPIELEAPLGELEAPDSGGRLFRRRRGKSTAPGQHRRNRQDGQEPVPAPEQHQQAREEAVPGSRPASSGEAAGTEGLAPLPRRRPGTPVLVSDHGRRVSGTHRLPEAAGGASTERTRAAGEASSRHEGREGREAGEGADAGPADTGPADTGPADTGADSDPLGGLPRRVRQASLAPQLKRDSAGTGTDAASPGAGTGDEALWDRDAEEVRSRMASLQRGWQRGRQQIDASADDSPAASGDTAPGTTPEGNGR